MRLRVALVLTLNPRGAVTAVTLSGPGALTYPPGRTARGIGLGNSYADVIRRYGYPDRTVTQGTSLELTYVGQGVRFRLDAMKVRQITVGSYVASAVPAAAPAVAAPAVPPVGMSLPELKGYL